MADKVVRRNFAENIDQRFSHLPPKKADVETRWSLFRTVILGATTETCEVKRIGPPIGQKRTAWWNDEVCTVVAEKKTVYRVWIDQRTADARQKYLQVPDRTKRVVAKAKSASWEKFGHRLESGLFIDRQNILADHPPPSKGSMSNNLLDQEHL